MHFELQVSYDADLPQRMLRYNVLLKNRHGLPVRSVAILLRPKADGPEMTGVVQHTLADEHYLKFDYRVVRIWRKPVADILDGGVGTLPLAPLAEVTKPELPGVILRMKERLKVETTVSEEAVLWTATYVLMGLRYDQALTGELLKGVRDGRIGHLSRDSQEGRSAGSTADLAPRGQRWIRRSGCCDRSRHCRNCRSRATGNPDPARGQSARLGGTAGQTAFAAAERKAQEIIVRIDDSAAHSQPRAQSVAQSGDILSHLLESYPADFVRLAGISTNAPIEAILKPGIAP